MPPEVPLARGGGGGGGGGIDWSALAERYHIVGASIKNCLIRAASWAAVRAVPSERCVSMADLEAAAEEELRLLGGVEEKPHQSMYL